MVFRVNSKMRYRETWLEEQGEEWGRTEDAAWGRPRALEKRKGS